MTNEEIVNSAKKHEKSIGFGELAMSELSSGVNSPYGIGFLDGAEWALSQSQIVEIFGKRVKAVVGDDSCENCVFQESVCKYISRGNLCQSADKKFNRHFVEVDEDGNEIKR